MTIKTLFIKVGLYLIVLYRVNIRSISIHYDKY